MNGMNMNSNEWNVYKWNRSSYSLRNKKNEIEIKIK